MHNEWLSILSFYLYDDSLFDDIKLPSEVNRDTLVNNLLLECSELEVMYSDYDFLKKALTFWSNSRIDNWQRMATLLNKEYDPFISMERYEERTINNTHSDNTKANASENSTGQADTYNNAWNSNDDTKRETLKNKADSINSQTQDTSGKSDTVDKFSSKGDSALYTKQEILKQEMDIRNEFNIYDYIINDFKKKFCILVY